jgi:glucosamine--fructose-6-phosphate aminotransferase (isomerizing)
MCGIVGYLGKQQAAPILMEGLKRLEYRGYDSCGLAVLGRKNKISSVKAVGRISELEKKLGHKNLVGQVGCGHTRWATHGAPTEKNAHPHGDCKGKIWLVHNGIIENYQELKKKLERRGHKFRSETDTEVLAHLIEEAAAGQEKLENAVRAALKKVKGTFGLVVISEKEPGKMIAARQSSPLLIGIGEGEYLVASDASAIVTYTKKVVYLDDGEIGVINGDGFRILTLDNREVTKKIQEIDWTIEKVQKGGHAHFMLKEIFEQPSALENSLRGRIIEEDGLAKLGGIENVENKLKKINRLIIVACGTAYLAGLVGEYMLEEFAGVPTEVEYASEFRYRKPILDKKTALLCISQSGETADTLAALQEAKRKGALTLGIVNVVGSSIARQTDAGIYNHIGPEIGVASTKAFTSQLCVLALLTLFLGRQRQMSYATGQNIARELKQLPHLAKQVLAQSPEIKKLAKKYFRFQNFFYLGRKYNFPIALEGALKLKEISYIHAEGYGAGEMKHGPIALIDKNFATFALAPQNSVYEKMASNMQEIKARHGALIALTTKGNKEIKKLTRDIIYMPETSEMLEPILAVIPLQLFAYFAALYRKCDIDKPRNLAKSVTVE